MNTATYTCPLCNKQLPREFVLFKEHSDQHIYEAIRRSHPEWAGEDGACKPCVEYYKKQIAGEACDQNIGRKGSLRRTVMGISMFAAVAMIVAYLLGHEHFKPVRLLIFIPLLAGFLGLMQARSKTCVVLSELGMRESGSGRKKLLNPENEKKLRIRGRGIFVKAVISAAAISAVFYLLP